MSITRKAVTSLTLDLSMPDVQTGFTCTLGDRARRLEILVTDGGRPYDIPPTWSAFLSGVKPDQTELVNGCVVEGGRLIYDFESGEQIATCAGRYAVTVWIMDEEGTPVASPKIWVNVIDSGVQTIMNNNSSEDQFGVLQEIVGTFNALIEKDAQVDRDIRNLIRREEIVIPSSTWKDETPLEYSNSVTVPLSGAKTILLYPANDESKAEATRVRLSAEVKTGTLYGYDATYTVFRSSGTEAPEIDIKLVAISMTPKEENVMGSSRVIMVGFDTTADDIDESIKRAADEIEQAKEEIQKAITVSSVLVPKDRFVTDRWLISAPTVDNGDVLLLMPSNNETRDEVSRLRIKANISVSSTDVFSSVILLKTKTDELENDLAFTIIRLKDDAENEPKVVMIGINTTADDIDESIKEAKNDIEKMVSVETVVVSKTAWTAAKTVTVALKGAADPDTVFFLFPANEPTKTAATKARMTTTATVPSSPSYGLLYATFNVEDVSFVKEIDLLFTVLHVREEGATERRAVLVGVDSYGDIIPTSIDLSSLDDGEVVETFLDGTVKTTTIEYDADGNPVKITDGDGNVTVLTW